MKLKQGATALQTGEIQPKRLSILGSTGSVGRQALDVAQALRYPVKALAACRNAETLERQVRRFRPLVAAMYDEAAAADLRVRVRDLPVRVTAGREGLCEAAALPEAEMTVNAVVGVAGLLPTLAAIEAGHDVALANKETLVAGGRAVTAAAAARGVRLLPVDSEHSAIFQCLQGAPPDDSAHRAVKRLILTASGGPFFGKSAQELEQMTPQQALRHPNWSMGSKITIDSATMMNKGLELIEACWLFGLPEKQIDIVVHRESVVHSLVEYTDHSVIAQLGVPDMRIPIQYALTWPQRSPSPVRELELSEWGTLSFYPPDDAAFPSMGICREAMRRGGLYPAAVNAANEQAVALFLDGRIGFGDIARLAAKPLDWTLPEEGDAGEILRLDEETRRRVTD